MDLQVKALLTQVVGFLVVVWLLKKYAWEGLLEFIEKRREHIASQFEEIERTRADAESLRERFDRELARIEETRRAKIQEAAAEADRLAAQIREEARQEALKLREKAERDIAMELDKANVALRDRMVAAVITATERLIRERLDDARHRELIDRFLADVELEGGSGR